MYLITERSHSVDKDCGQDSKLCIENLFFSVPTNVKQPRRIICVVAVAEEAKLI
jgi:hypothetical protein